MLLVHNRYDSSHPADCHFEQSAVENLEKQQLETRIDKINKELKNAAEKLSDQHNDGFCLLRFANKLLEDKFREAREARNDIAHDLGKGIEHCAEDDEWREKLIKEVKTLVQKIAEADVSVYNLCQYLANEPTFKGDYCEAAVRWVCEESQKENQRGPCRDY